MDRSLIHGRADGDRVVILTATKAGLYLLIGDNNRETWEQRGPYLTDCNVNHARFDPRDGSIWATANDGNPRIVRSTDLGETWTTKGDPFECDSIWHIEPGRPEDPATIYAGLKPAALVRSTNGGESWESVVGLNQHETAEEWWEGGGGKILHTILFPRDRPGRIYAGISVAGVFRSDDDGATWNPINTGIIDSLIEAEVKHPSVHRCVHKVAIHPHNSDILFQQNHDGIYRSDDAGSTWIDIGAGLPSRFGFPIAVSDGAAPTVFVVPEDGDTLATIGYLAVWRSTDAGETWIEITAGLPRGQQNVLREAMKVDNRNPAGIYLGTKAGSVFASIDNGLTYAEIASGLPFVRSIEIAYAG